MQYMRRMQHMYICNIMEFIQLYDSLTSKVLSANRADGSNISEKDLDLLRALGAEHLDELKCHCCEYPFASLILILYGKKEFYRIADLLIYRIDDRVFEWIMGGNQTDDDKIAFAPGHHPIDLDMFDLDESLDAIVNYYDCQIELIYPVLARRILSNDKERGRKKIIDALKAHGWSEPETETLDSIYKELYGESPNWCDDCHLVAPNENHCHFCGIKKCSRCANCFSFNGCSVCGRQWCWFDGSGDDYRCDEYENMRGKKYRCSNCGN